MIKNLKKKITSKNNVCNSDKPITVGMRFFYGLLTLISAGAAIFFGIKAIG